MDASTGPAPAAPSEAPTAPSHRRLVVPLAVLALAACGCLVISAVAWWNSDDLRATTEERIGIDDPDIVTGSSDLVPGAVAAEAEVAGRVVLVNASVGQDVEEGDALALTADDEATALGIDAQRLLESSWAFLDDLSAAEPSESMDDLSEAVETATENESRADSAFRSARMAGGAGATLERLETRADLARIALQVAKARLALAEGTLSDADVDAVQTALEQAQAWLPPADAQPAFRSIEAPMSGVVTAVLVAPGDSVEPGDEVARIADGAPLEAWIHVSETDADRLDVGDAAEVRVEGFDEPFDGTILDVFERNDGGSDDEDKPFVVRISVDDPYDDLDEGDAADLRIDTNPE